MIVAGLALTAVAGYYHFTHDVVALVALGFSVFQRTNRLERALTQLADSMAELKRSNLDLQTSQERFALVVRGSTDGRDARR